MPGDRKTNPHELTDLQLRFCHEYVKDLNKTRAYIRAGYKVKNDNSAAASASVLLRNPNIQAYLGEIAGLSNVAIIAEVVMIALSRITDILEYTDGNIKIKNSAEWNIRAQASVKSITVSETLSRDGVTRTTTVTMHDKLAALEKLMRKLRLYPKDIPVLDAVQLLLAEGVATPEQARVIGEGVGRIEEELRGLGKLD
ncbi:terminase small subunit [Nostoc sp. CHAB 5836]|uniref:terminase small subunit n=1 Tax=Nostoc sp. CHAB 5836 TaxID=2780404 RepID=UPI001E4A7336|nr:terminase small subunit [Nostoc sp. CHAB 5836]MCC5616384.1 terminase small subunit [Nostoc sp. CHAB 5836]